MNTFYFIVGSIVFIMLFYFFRKINKTKQKEILPKMKTEKNTKQKVVQPKAPAKNKWLNPTDSFGKMEKGVVRDSET